MRPTAILALFLASVGQPALAASSPELIGLERQLNSLVAGRAGEYGIAALDLRDGTNVSVNGDTAFPMASTVKVAIAATYLAQVDHGRRSLANMIDGRSAAKLMELMITRSDNHATDELLHNLGGPSTVQQWLSFNSVTGIRVDRTIAQLLRDPRELNDRHDVATPMAMVMLLRKIDSGNVLTADSRAALLQLMARCETGTRRIRALLPAGTRVEDKTGTLNGVTNDVGFITMPDGHRVAVAVFARGGTERQRGIAEAARVIYDRFSAGVRSMYASLTTVNSTP
ncbi:MAG: class A beta-lactamase-related serine hydrolase [Pseudomonadota bacterium]|nr:class A beta-lactamase-related serine hydrolase [Pseudomonadota bacterium]